MEKTISSPLNYPSTSSESPGYDNESPQLISEAEEKRRNVPFVPNIKSAIVGKPDYTNI